MFFLGLGSSWIIFSGLGGKLASIADVILRLVFVVCINFYQNVSHRMQSTQVQIQSTYSNCFCDDLSGVYRDDGDGDAGGGVEDHHRAS